MTSQENKKVDAKFIIGLPQRYDFGLTREIWIQYAGEYKGLSDLSWILYPLGRENSQHCFQFQGKGCRGQFEKNKLHALHSVVHMKKKIPIKPARIFIGRLFEAKTAPLAGSAWTQSDRGFCSLSAEFIPRVPFIFRE